jgi:hypothetical protein
MRDLRISQRYSGDSGFSGCDTVSFEEQFWILDETSGSTHPTTQHQVRKPSILRYFMFCWPCISIYACNETNLIYYWSSVYSVTIPLHVSGLLAAHHQEVAMYICNNWYVLYVSVDGRRAWINWRSIVHQIGFINPLNAELNPICHLLALLGGATIVDVSRLRVKRILRLYEFCCTLASVSYSELNTGLVDKIKNEIEIS